MAGQCDRFGEFTVDDWYYLIDHCPNQSGLLEHCDKWDRFSCEQACRLLSAHPQLADKFDDLLRNRFTLVHWARIISSGEGQVFVQKMSEMGKTELISDWCCPNHWAEEYKSFFVRCAAATSREHKVRRIAEMSVMNPYGEKPGRYHSDISRHVLWLASVAAEFAKAAAVAADPECPEVKAAEEYSLIAEAAKYEIDILAVGSSNHGSGCMHPPTVVHEK